MGSLASARNTLALAGLVAVAVVGLAAVAWACTPNANIILYPKSGQAGDIIRVEGNQFVPGETVHVRWNGAQGEHLVTTTGPTFSEKVQIPEDAADGVHDVVAYAAAAPHNPKARFRVTSPSSQTDGPEDENPPPQGETRNYANGGGSTADGSGSTADGSGSNTSGDGSNTSGDAATTQQDGSPTGPTSQSADGNPDGTTSQRADGGGGSPDNAGATTSQPQPAPSRDGRSSSPGSQAGQPQQADQAEPAPQQTSQQVGAQPDRRGQAPEVAPGQTPESGRSRVAPDPQPQATQSAQDRDAGETQPGSAARDRGEPGTAPGDRGEPATGTNPDGSVAEQSEPTEAETDGNGSSAPARVPDRVATGDLWSGFDSPSRRSLAPNAGDIPAGSSGPGEGLALGLGLFAAGLLTLLGGAFSLAARRSRALATPTNEPPRT